VSMFAYRFMHGFGRSLAALEGWLIEIGVVLYGTWTSN
jgi:hypothetical protein